MNRGHNKKKEGRRLHMYWTERTVRQASELAEALGTSMTMVAIIAISKMHREEFGRAGGAKESKTNGAGNAQVHR